MRYLEADRRDVVDNSPCANVAMIDNNNEDGDRRYCPFDDDGGQEFEDRQLKYHLKHIEKRSWL